MSPSRPAAFCSGDTSDGRTPAIEAVPRDSTESATCAQAAEEESERFEPQTHGAPGESYGSPRGCRLVFGLQIVQINRQRWIRFWHFPRAARIIMLAMTPLLYHSIDVG